MSFDPARPAESADRAQSLANRLDAGSRSGPSQGAVGTGEAQQLARLAGEFESMLLMQMLREMRKSGSWADEDEEKLGFGAESMFESIDVELAAHLQKAQSFGLVNSLVNQVTGQPAGTVTTLPASLPPPTFDTSSRRGESLDSPQGTTLEVSETDVHPLDRIETSPFGWRRDPFTGATTYHRGVDLRAAYGEPIGAAAPGKVVFAGEQGGYGQTVVVEHADGLRSRYAHLSAVLAEVGAEVQAGESLGRAGRSGRATGTHLHFEVTQNGRPVDPRTLAGAGQRADSSALGMALKPDRLTADWGVGVGPTLPGAADGGE